MSKKFPKIYVKFHFFFFFEKQKCGPLWLYYIPGQGVSTGISLMRPKPVLCEGANPH